MTAWRTIVATAIGKRPGEREFETHLSSPALHRQLHFDDLCAVWRILATAVWRISRTTWGWAMNHENIIKLLMLVKGNWYRQPTDDLTIRVWQEILGEEIDARDAVEAVMEVARSGAKEPPTPGMVFRAAMELAKRREEQERRARKSIEELPSDEERERMRQNFSNLIYKLARSVVAESVEVGATDALGAIQSAATTSAASRAIDPETERAQEIILKKRREKLR